MSVSAVSIISGLTLLLSFANSIVLDTWTMLRGPGADKNAKPDLADQDV